MSLDAWPVASSVSIIESARAFVQKVFDEHDPTCTCRRCAEAAYVGASLRSVIVFLEQEKEKGTVR